MKIYTKGIGEKSFAPECVRINFDFKTRSEKYDLTLTEGVKQVENFVNVLTKLGFKKEDFKTDSFKIYEETKYDANKQENIRLGYIYNHIANLKFDYDMNKLTLLVYELSKIDFGPRTNITFELKDEDKKKSECIDLAYQNAKSKAEAIATSAGKKLVECKKISFEPLDNTIQSRSRFDGLAKMTTFEGNDSIKNAMGNILVPENIKLFYELYCLWIAE